MKKCSSCKELLDYSHFHKNSSKKDGYKDICKKCRVQKTRDYYLKNKETILKKTKEYSINNKDKLYKSKKEWARNNYNPEERRKLYLKYKDKINSGNKTKYNTDILYRLKRCLSRRLYMAVKSNKNHSVVEYLGCNIQEFKNYIEHMFFDGMSWDNYGKWHIDHIIPLSSANSENDLYKLCHYTNMQPLWALDNIKKSNKMA
jgi:hypothetical protein